MAIGSKAKTLACIGIPVYKAQSDETEMRSYQQAVRIFYPKYSIYLIAPHSLDVSAYQNETAAVKIARFPDKYFRNITSYSRLLISPGFYKRFDAYKYLLIYQLDAYVFRDELDWWCRQGYDYIGPPWINEEWMHRFRKDVGINFNLKHINRVGNGGFSLRRISTFYYTSLVWGYLWYFWQKNEDFYWSNIFSRLNPFFKIPDVKTALKFGFDLDPQQCFEMNNNQLPFGCHAWEKDKTGFWKNYIK